MEIDTLTGVPKVLRVDILHDVGKSLNPAIDLGQIEGGFVQGMGWLTSEELVYSSAGELLTHGLSTYKIPTATDRPEMNIRLWDGQIRGRCFISPKRSGNRLLCSQSAYIQRYATRLAVSAQTVSFGHNSTRRQLLKRS